MLNNLKSVYLNNCSFLKLRFTYIIINSQKTYKFDYLVRILDFDEKKRVSIKDFLLSIFINVISPILCLQSSNIKWLTVSLIYESNMKNKNNLYLIPLKNIIGQMENLKAEEITLRVSLRFENSPRPINVKIYGISSIINDNNNILEKNLIALEKAFTDTFLIKSNSLKYSYIYPKTSSVLIKQGLIKKNKKNNTIQQQLDLDVTHRKPILALTNL